MMPAAADSGSLSIRRLTNTLRRRKRQVIGVTVAGTLLVAMVALSARPSYTALAEVLIGTVEDASSGPTKPAISPDDSAVDTQIAMLASDAQLCRLLRGLPARPEFNAEPNDRAARNSGLLAWVRAKLVAVLSVPAKLFPGKAASADLCGWPAGGRGPHLAAIKAGLKVFQQRHSLVISVSYTGPDPAQAAAIVNEIVGKDVEQQRAKRREQAAEVVAWLDGKLAAAIADRDAAENAVRQARLAGGADLTSKDDLHTLVEARQQLALVESDLERRAALLKRARLLRQGGAEHEVAAALGVPVDASGASGTEGSAQLADAIQESIRKLESEVQFGKLQAQAIRADIDGLQRAAAPPGGEQKSLQSLEHRAAALTSLTEDLERRRNGSLQSRDLATADVSVFTLAQSPIRPSGIAPMLLIPSGMFAFLLLGSALAFTLDHFDASFRSERDVSVELGVPCVGLIPEMSTTPSKFREDTVLADMRPSYYQAVRSVLVSVFEFARLERQPKIVLLTSSVPEEGKSILGISLGLCAAQLGQRVLLVDLGEGRPGTARSRNSVAEWVMPALASGEAAKFITPVPSLGYDYLSGSEIGVDLLAFLISRSGQQLFRQLRSKYDCIIVDGPSVLGSAEARILASVADEVLLAVRWGSTRRDLARYAVDLFRASGMADDGGQSRLKAVLTRADLPAHARYRYGDAAELLVTYDRPSRPRLRLASQALPPRRLRATLGAVARSLAASLGGWYALRQRRSPGADRSGALHTDPAGHG